MNVSDAIVDLGREHLSRDNPWYAWRPIDHAKLPPGITLPDGSEYRQNVDLKHRLHEQWLNSDDEGRFALCRYYVSTWGGVRRNKPETLRQFAEEPVEATIGRGTKGIASWSKILCVRNPDLYAIYDARVAVSLNILQHLMTGDKQLFPLLKGQNRTINTAASRIAAVAGAEGWHKLSSGEFYEIYLSYSRQAARRLSVELCTVEMLLFAFAPKLVIRASQEGRF